MGQVKGIDVSSWQHPYGEPIDWEEVAKEGFGFAMVKASQGTTYTNPWLARDLDDARAAGLLVGAYHYLEIGPDPGEQANLFVACLMGVVLDMGGWCDFEPGAVQPAMAQNALSTFRLAVDNTRPNCGLYCDLAWLKALKEAYVSVGRLWLADWTAAEPKEGQLIWQEGQATVKGVPTPVDVNVCGSVRALNLPTAPPVKPTAATVRPARPVLTDEQGDEAGGTGPEPS